MHTENSAKFKSRAFAWLKLAVLIMIIVGIPLFIYTFYREEISGFRSVGDAAEFLRDYREMSIPVYLIAEVLQILVSILPGQIFQMAAGYVFGFAGGTLLTAVGAAIGSVITFFLARVLGSDAVHMMLGEERSKHYSALLNSRRAYLITFIIYLIPGLPKDTVCYVAGITDMKLLPFLAVSLTGRMPAMAASVAFGALYMKQDYRGMALVALTVALISVVCLIKRRTITSYLDSLYEKYV